MLSTAISRKMEAIELHRIARLAFAVALFGFGMQHLIFGHFVTGRADVWPTDAGGERIWASVTGAWIIFVSIMVLQQRKVRLLCIILGVMIFVMALLKYVPILAANFTWGGYLTNAGKALTLFGGAFVLAGYASPLPTRVDSTFSRLVNSKDGFIYLARFCMGAYLIICGIEHFLFDQFVATLVPGWIPGPFFWTYFSGVALIAGGTGLLLNATVTLAAVLSGVMIFLWVLMIHIPRALSIQDQNEWTAVCEALAFSAINFLLATSPRGDKGAYRQFPQ